MENEELVVPSVEKTALTLAAAGELTAQIFRRVAGNDVSTGLNGETLSKEMLSTMAIGSLRRELSAV